MILLLLVLAVGFSIASALGPRNLALGRHVFASSVCAYTPAPKYRSDRFYRLVDGERIEATFAACTEVQVHPWITVDLGSPRSIDDVVLHARSDCCWGIDDVPLSVQLSDDSVRYTTVATRRDPFTDDFPWKAKIGGTRARYVRIHRDANTPGSIVLSEVEVHGR